MDELWAELASAGFVGVNIPEQYGGGGMGTTELVLVEEELAAAGCPSMMMVVSSAVCAPLLAAFGDEDQKSQWLTALASGEVMAFAITESDTGSNSAAIRTTARRVPGGWTLNGSKTFISGAADAAATLVVARTGPGRATARGELSVFIVPRDSIGLTMSPIPTEVQAPEQQYAVFLDNVELPDECLVGTEGLGLAQIFHGLNAERVLSAAVCNGLGRYCLDRAVDYAREREVWQQPIGAHQGIAFPLAEAKIELETARLTTHQAAMAHDTGEGAGELANMAKYVAAKAAARCLDTAIQTHGGNGLATEYGLADLWGLVRLYQIAPVSREMILNRVAHHVLGLPKSY